MPIKVITKILLCCFFLLLTNAIASNETSLLQQAIDHYLENKFNDALPILIKLTKQNNAEAHHYLGIIYSDRGFKEYDPKIAINHLMSAVHLNHTPSMFQLGLMYDNGEGVKLLREFGIKSNKMLIKSWGGKEIYHI